MTATALKEKKAGALDVRRIREDFPILHQKVRGKPLVYLDNAATSQKPKVVIEALSRYYENDNANIHRGVHLLSERATELYEKARETVRRFVNARESHEILFTRGTTEAINLVAQSYGQANLKPGDEILISALEHHSNIVPWQMIGRQTGAVLKVIPMTDSGELMMEDCVRLLSARTKFVSVGHVSNALGTINPVREIIRLAHGRGIPVLVDAAQSIPHLKVDVQELDCDFLAFSGHKVYGPTGIGGLYGKASFLEKMPPYQGGGDMIRTVSFGKTTYADLPYKFEAGTPNIAGGIGLAAALEYVQALGLDAIAAYEHELLEYGTQVLSKLPGLGIVGTAKEKAAVISFVLENIHPHDIGTILDQEGIAIRTGHHCAMPVMERLGISATARASFAFYNTKEEIDALAQGLKKVKGVLGV